ncbi:MAG TPA: ABC transporter ATP-binding protein [Gemmataceae bacterium]|jgi:ABC-2 type transport system ATP-binding protein
MSKSDAPVVVIDGLTKKYGDLLALDHLSLTLDRGRILGFIGPNGAGKTTAIKILVGQLRPTAGSARIAGADCTRDSDRIKRLVGYMPDNFGSYDNMRVWEYLDFFGAAFGIRPGPRRQRIDEVLETTGSTYMRDRFVEGLSHGMRQRVGLARTLLHDPEVLILDEPANGLDPQARIEMRDILLRLAAAGKTLLVTSHILPELARICDQVAIITHGKLRAFGVVSEIMRQVQQRRLVEVQLASADQLDQAAAVIAPLVEPDAGVTTAVAEAIVRFSTQKSENYLGRILTRLIRAKIRVNQFREVQSDLEDTFLSITRQRPVPSRSGAGSEAELRGGRSQAALGNEDVGNRSEGIQRSGDG